MDLSRYLLGVDVQGLLKALQINDLQQLPEVIKTQFNFDKLEQFLHDISITYRTYKLSVVHLDECGSYQIEEKEYSEDEREPKRLARVLQRSLRIIRKKILR